MNYLNGLEFIKEFVNYAMKDVSFELEIWHYSRKYFHPEHNRYYYFNVYRYDTKKDIFFLPALISNHILKLNLTDISRFVKFKIKFCKYFKHQTKDGKIINHFSLIGYYKEDVAAQTIERYWLKYRWNYRKNKIQSLKQELMQNVYHPSKIDFTI